MLFEYFRFSNSSSSHSHTKLTSNTHIYNKLVSWLQATLVRFVQWEFNEGLSIGRGGGHIGPKTE